jgi:hypothetical protein
MKYFPTIVYWRGQHCDGNIGIVIVILALNAPIQDQVLIGKDMARIFISIGRRKGKLRKKYIGKSGDLQEYFMKKLEKCYSRSARLGNSLTDI